MLLFFLVLYSGCTLKESFNKIEELGSDILANFSFKNVNGEIIRWFGTNTDITNQKKMTDDLQEEQNLREKFISTLSHDLRTPLSVAKISAQLIIKKTDEEEIRRSCCSNC